ncbi:MAG: GLUG motif-containing protein, partial [Anaerohalosphaeraceae bacterium]
KWQKHYGAGCGTLEDPYQIQAPWHMNSIGLNPCDWNKHFILMADIDMSFYVDIQYNIIGNSTTKFTGSFDGNGHIIRNLTYIKEGVADCVGLFGRIENASIKNLGLIDVVFYSGSGNVGGLVGWNDSGTLKNCYVTGVIRGTGHIGGLIGRNNTGSLTACCTLATVTGTSIVGGLIGGNYSGSILNCYANCSIHGTGNYIGGLTGYNSKGTLAACYASGIFDNTGSYVGGLAGWNSADAIVSSCFWDTQTSGKDKGVGGGSSGGMTGKTTAEMQTLSTFTSSGWDFTNEIANGNRDLWRMCTDGKYYPKLSWQSIDGDSACPDGVAVEDLIALAINWMSIETLDPTGFNYACDSNQNGIIGIEDLAALSLHWIKPEVIISQVEACSHSAPANTLAAPSSVPFTARVEGSYIIFDHAIEQNCCISGIQLNVVQEPGRIILEETITWNSLCFCICTFPTHAELGPFVPGEYVFEVVQIEGHWVTSFGEISVSIE